MPSYFFHLVGNGEVIRDAVGAQLVDDEAARRVAQDVVEEFRNRPDFADGGGIGWRMVIMDASGRIVAELPIAPLHS